jgi:hypothetical protein
MERVLRALWKPVTLVGLSILAIPAEVHATTAAPSTPAPAPDGTAAGVVFAIAILALLVVTGIAVKLHDRKRKVEDEVAALQGRISDAFFADRVLSTMAVTPTVRMPFRRNGLVTVTLTGTVLTPEARDAAIQLAMHAMEESQVSFQLEDRILVDPMISRRAA